MIPIRILLVDEVKADLRQVKENLEALGGFEVITAASPAWGMLCLARHQPDVLLVNPMAGRGSVEEWRRAVHAYRSSRSLGVLVLGHQFTARDHEILEDLADLGLIERPYNLELIGEALEGWAGTEESYSRAA